MFIAPSGIENWYHNVMQEELEKLNAYITESEIGNSTSILEFYKKQKYHVKELDEYHVQVTYFHRELENSSPQHLEWFFKNEFPRLQRNSTLVTILSMFEKNLYELCECVRKELNIEKAFLNIKNKSKIGSIKDYLHQKAKILKSDEMEKNWSTLLTLNSIRNNIVHNYGKYEYQTTWVNNFVLENNNIKVTEDYNEFEMNNMFLSELISFFVSFCHELQAALRIRKLE